MNIYIKVIRLYKKRGKYFTVFIHKKDEEEKMKSKTNHPTHTHTFYYLKLIKQQKMLILHYR